MSFTLNIIKVIKSRTERAEIVPRMGKMKNKHKGNHKKTAVCHGDSRIL
jgi:hypothetical protein